MAYKLLRLLSETGSRTRANADDVLILWCREVQITVNTETTEAVLFTRKYKDSPVLGLRLFGKEIKVYLTTN